MANRRPRRRLVDLLSFVFGLGSWVAMTGLWMEMPLLVQTLPEGPALASFLSLALQAANVGCIIYAVAYKLRPRRSTEDVAVHLQMFLGTLACFLLVFLWRKTAVIGGEERSVALLTLGFVMSLVDCVSSVSFLPVMARFRSPYMTPYLAGEGVGGFIPGLVAVAQGIGHATCEEVNVTVANVTQIQSIMVFDDPRFSESVFLSTLVIIFLASWAAFVLLNYLSQARKEQVNYNEKETTLDEAVHYPEEKSMQVKIQSPTSKDSMSISKKMYLYFMFLQGWGCLATFGIFPAVQPYSLIPYGYSAFHWGVTICGLAYPLACGFVGLVEVRGPRSLGIMTLVATIIAVLIFCTALLSPQPPLHGTKTGAVLIVMFWLAFTLLFSYIKTMVTIVLLEAKGHNAMFWVGVVTQVGGIVGSMLMFLLINVASGFFTNPDKCDL